MKQAMWACLMVVGLMVLMMGRATANEQRSYPVITLETAIHFPGPDGADQLIPAGQFSVSPAGGNLLQLRPLTTGGASTPTILAAEPITVPIQLDTQAAVLVAHEGNQYSIVWVRPDGTGLEARGNSSGIGTRGLALTCDQVCQARLRQTPKTDFGDKMKSGLGP